MGRICEKYSQPEMNSEKVCVFFNGTQRHGDTEKTNIEKTKLTEPVFFSVDFVLSNLKIKKLCASVSLCSIKSKIAVITHAASGRSVPPLATSMHKESYFTDSSSVQKRSSSNPFPFPLLFAIIICNPIENK